LLKIKNTHSSTKKNGSTATNHSFIL